VANLTGLEGDLGFFSFYFSCFPLFFFHYFFKKYMRREGKGFQEVTLTSPEKILATPIKVIIARWI
jgi:hypothetical protein